MKTPIPHVNTIEDLEERLRAKRGTGFPKQLFVFIPIVAFLLWFLFRTRAESSYTQSNFDWQTLLYPFSYVAPTVVFVALAISLKGYVVLRKRIPSDFRVQCQSLLTEAMLAGAITLALFFSTLALAVPTLAMLFDLPSLESFAVLAAIILAGLTYVLGSELVREFQVLRHYATTYWRRVRVTATFDKATYQSGERINVRVSDRLSESSAAPHRVHLSYVEEKIVYTGGAKGTDSEYWRHPKYNFFLDVSAAELHRGVVLALPEPSAFERITALEDKRPRYWKVLVEEHGCRFYSRFFVDVR